jgi:uridine phosphorylase
MNFPIYPEKYKIPEMVTAGAMLEFRRKYGGLDHLQAPHSMVLCLYNGLMKRLAWRYPSRHVDSFQCDLHLLKRTEGRVGVAGNFGMGAPAVTALAEQMIAWGTRRLVILSLSGGLQPDLEPGSIVLCDGAMRDEGTSYHYLPPARQVSAAPALVASISAALGKGHLPFSIGTTWSTDAAYRETRPEADYFRNLGVRTVDMESAGLFAVGQVRGVETASVFVVGDQLTDARWMLPVDMHALHQRFKALLDVLIGALEEDR